MRRKSAQSLFESALGIIVFVGVLLVLVDLAMILLAVQINSAACAEAARTAAIGDPAEAAQRAEATLLSSARRPYGALLSDVSLLPPVRIEISKRPLSHNEPFSGKTINPGGAVEGEVLVSTEIQVRPFFLHCFYGGQLPMKFRSSQAAPISYVAPPQPARMVYSEEDLP